MSVNRLTRIEVDEISLLTKGTRPAVRGALVVLAKAETSGSNIEGHEMDISTPAEAEAESLARQRMQVTGESFEKSLTVVLSARPELYDRAEAERAMPEHATRLRKAIEESNRHVEMPKSEPERQLDALVKSHLAKTCGPADRGWCEVLATSEGQRLYDQAEQAKAGLR